MESNHVTVRTAARVKYRPRPAGDPTLLEHSHRLYQLVAVTAGKSSITLSGEVLDAAEGDIFFLAPGVSHTLYSLSGEMSVNEVRFSVSDEMAALLACVPHRILADADRVRDLVAFAVLEGVDRRPHYRELVALAVESALYILARAHAPQLAEGLPLLSRTEGTASGIETVREYLEKKFDERITLKSLADRFSLTREHLCRSFTAAFGVSPIHYLNECRYKHARTLLAETDMSVTEVAAATGYSSIHYFSRAFSGAAGVSPYEFRRECRGAEKSAGDGPAR